MLVFHVLFYLPKKYLILLINSSFLKFSVWDLGIVIVMLTDNISSVVN